MRGPPVVLTDTLGRPVTNVISERGAVPMTVVNTLGEPVTLVNSGGEPVTLFNENGTLWDYPFSLFSNNEQGAWYDPSDYSTLYQDAAGTTPVTAVEQPVRLMLDRSKGLVLGPELVTNGGFDTNLNGWTLSGTNLPTWSASGIVLTSDGSFFSRARQSFTTIVGLTYRLTFDVVTPAGSLNVKIGTSAGASNVLASGNLTSSGARSYVFFAQSTTTHIELENGSVASPVLDNISIKALPGNHATAPNDASRPVLRARYNLLTYTEQFDNAAWQKNDGSSVTANAVVAPDGTTTADQIDLSASELSRVQQPLSGQPTASYTFTVWLRVASGSVSVRFSSSADLDVITVTDTWQRFTSTKTITTPTQPNLTIRNEAGGGAKTLYAWGASVLTAADQASTGGAYQRIAAATDYDTSNPVWRPYLAFDGSDDSMSTSSIDFSGTDEMTVFAGVSKLSDAADAAIVELSSTVSNAGAFLLAASIDLSGARSTYFTRVNGNGGGSFLYYTGFASPVTNVLTASYDIAGTTVETENALRANGVAQTGAGASGSAGTGNFGNYPLFIGRRNNASLPFNGRLYGLTVLGRTATAPELSAMETWINGKTGAY